MSNLTGGNKYVINEFVSVRQDILIILEVVINQIWMYLFPVIKSILYLAGCDQYYGNLQMEKTHELYQS